jgi:hypothetical protein
VPLTTILYFYNVKYVYFFFQVLETRAISGDLLRQFSVSQFSKAYGAFPQEHRPDSARQFCEATAAAYQPKRKFRKQGQAYATPASQVEGTLLEYGQRLFSSSIVDPTTGSGSDDAKPGRGGAGVGALAAKLDGAFGGAGAAKKGPKTAEEEAKEAADRQAEEDQRLSRMAEGMAAIGSDGRISGSQLGKIVSMQADEISTMNDAYTEDMAQVADGAGGAQGGARALEQQHNRQMESLNRQQVCVTVFIFQSNVKTVCGC